MSSKRKEIFIERIMQMKKNQKQSHFTILTGLEYNQLLEEVKAAKSSQKKTTLQRRRLQRFDIIEVDKIRRLIAKQRDGGICFYLPVDEIYDVIDSTHISTNHGGRGKVKKETSSKYANITSEMITLFLTMCESCQLRRKKKQEFILSPPLDTTSISRCQIDLINMHISVDGIYKFILVYQDCLTKFVVLSALQSNNENEIAHKVFDIFTTFGVPCIVQSCEGCQFVKKIIAELNSLWPDIKLVCGKPNCEQTDVLDIQNRVATWLGDNKYAKWSDGLGFIQFTKNNIFREEIKQTPYKAMFGLIEPRFGLASVMLPADVADKIEDEENLETYLKILKDSHGNNEIEGSCIEADKEEVNITDHNISVHKYEENIDCPMNAGDVKIFQIQDTYQYALQCSKCNKNINIDEKSFDQLSTLCSDCNNVNNVFCKQESTSEHFIKVEDTMEVCVSTSLCSTNKNVHSVSENSVNKLLPSSSIDEMECIECSCLKCQNVVCKCKESKLFHNPKSPNNQLSKNKLGVKNFYRKF